MGAVAVVLIALGTLVAAAAVLLSSSLSLLMRERARAADARAALDHAAREHAERAAASRPDASETAERHLAFAREALDQAESRLRAAARRHPFAARILRISAAPATQPAPAPSETGSREGGRT